jgi:hypothetical protein
MTTKADCAAKIAGYLASELSHDDLVKWADSALVEEAFPQAESRVLLSVLAALAASRSAGFQHRVEDYQALLRELGFRIEARLVAAWP